MKDRMISVKAEDTSAPAPSYGLMGRFDDFGYSNFELNLLPSAESKRNMF